MASRRAITGDEARRLGGRFVTAAAARGAAEGDRIAFTASNGPELLAAVFATLLSGRAPVVLSASLTESERRDLLADAEPSLHVDDELLAELVDEGREPAELTSWFGCRPMHFTSGTSGRPKGVWSGWLSQSEGQEMARDEADVWRFEAADRHLVSAPLSHSAPLRFALHTLLYGGSVTVQESFSAADTAALLASGEITTAFLAPTHLQRLLAVGPQPTRALRWVAHAGSSCPDVVRRGAAEVLGEQALVEFYGATEGQFTVCPYVEWEQRPGTVGRARPGRELEIVDGEVWCRPPPTGRFEYWRAPEKTAQAWDGDRFTVGDLGRIDDDGYLFLEGRRGDLIITGGVNVYPAEVERVLAELEGVRQVAVFGVDDPDWGQRVCAVVIGDLTAADVDAQAVAHLAPYKRPKTVLVTDRLPLTHSGKVDRRRLPELVE